MKRAELFAYPAWHSLSPAMHNAAFQSLGIEARYLAREVPPAELAGAVQSLRDPEVLGANVTIPHKEAVMAHLDTLSPEARAVGAVNTIVRRGETLHGHTTDVAGFLQALVDLEFDLHDRQVLLLGAGGAARAVAYAVLMADAAKVMIHNRSHDRAVKLAGDLQGVGEIAVVEAGGLEEAAAGADLVVNATSVGMLQEGMTLDETPLPAQLLPGRGAVVDLIYRPERTRLLREAEEAGLRTQNGLPMLVYQGAESFRQWTDRDAPIAEMREAALRALAG